MNLTIIGTGYVGLVTGVCFAEKDNFVTCVDIDENKISMLKNAKTPIFEPGLDGLLVKNIHNKSINFTTNVGSAVENADIIFLCLPTPPGEDGSADLSYVLGVAKELAGLIKDGTVIVNKSTVPVGTAKKIKDVLSHNTKVNFDVVSNPEFLKEGFAIEDFMKPDRIVIGSDSRFASATMEKLYKPFVSSDQQIIIMDIPSAEMTKYAANSFLATKITFMNEIANLCEKVGADVDSVRIGIGSDERIGNKFLYAGIGYGGSCFPKDVQALQKTAHEYGTPINILDAVSVANNNQKSVLLSKIKAYYGELYGLKFAIWGLAFKANTDDIREAPALELIKDLVNEGAKVSVYDPEALENVKKYFKDLNGITYLEEKYSCLNGSDALVIPTEWEEFKNADIAKINKIMKKSIIFDGRNIFDLVIAEKFDYYESIGRKVVKK